MGMVMKFPNGETHNLLIEVFNYDEVCSSPIRYTSGFAGLSLIVRVRQNDGDTLLNVFIFLIFIT